MKPTCVRTCLAQLAAAAVIGCRGAPSSPPAPPRPLPRTALAVQADTLFWRAFHAGAYDHAGRVMVPLKAAYLQNPQDAQTAAHVGFLHAWQLAERARLAEASPAITDHAVLARKFFEHAAARAPDARFSGFAAAFAIVEARLDGDSAALTAALARARRSIEQWPEFNWFTIGYTLSSEPYDSPLYREALDWQWRTLDACQGTAVDREHPVVVPIAADAPPPVARACSNSWIAPHNLEGFYLNLGDMLVKAGNVSAARRVYALVTRTASYSAWPFRAALEARVAEADTNVIRFRRGGMMGQSAFACAACHQTATP